MGSGAARVTDGWYPQLLSVCLGKMMQSGTAAEGLWHTAGLSAQPEQEREEKLSRTSSLRRRTEKQMEGIDLNDTGTVWTLPAH